MERAMSNEYKDRMLSLLTQVDDVKAKESAFQDERKRHFEQIAKSEEDLKRTEDDIAQMRDEEARLKRELTDLRDEIFARPEDEAAPIMDESHIPTSEGSQESEARRLWRAQAKLVRASAI
jgi:chromosome segregation ATPase